MRPVESLTDKERALEAVLLFHDGGRWDGPKSLRWYQLTGQTDATTKVLCDLVRTVLANPDLRA